MFRDLATLAAGLLMAGRLFAAQSTVTEAEGTASLGDDRTRKQTEQAALADAKRNAVERTQTYLRSETRVENGMLESDVIESFADATVNVLEVLEKRWHRDQVLGDCFTVRIRAEVVPDEKALERAMAGGTGAAAGAARAEDPSGLLSVRAWAGKAEYRAGEKMRFFVRGNKPFYARAVYRDAAGGLVQLLPNPFRADNYFNGGTVYELPSGQDQFELEVSPPFGAERLTVYASTRPLGDVGLKEAGGVYQVTTKPAQVAGRTRGVKLQKRSDGGTEPAEFAESEVEVRTAR